MERIKIRLGLQQKSKDKTESTRLATKDRLI
jgi:hypothetical protein